MLAGEVDLDLEVNMEKEMFGASSLLTMFVIERNRRWKWTDRWVKVEDEVDEEVEMDEVEEEEKEVGGCVDEEVDVCASREIHRKIWHNMLWAVWAHIIDTCH